MCPTYFLYPFKGKKEIRTKVESSRGEAKGVRKLRGYLMAGSRLKAGNTTRPVPPGGNTRRESRISRVSSYSADEMNRKKKILIRGSCRL